MSRFLQAIMGKAPVCKQSIIKQTVYLRQSNQSQITHTAFTRRFIRPPNIASTFTSRVYASISKWYTSLSRTTINSPSVHLDLGFNRQLTSQKTGHNSAEAVKRHDTAWYLHAFYILYPKEPEVQKKQWTLGSHTAMAPDNLIFHFQMGAYTESYQEFPR